MRCADTRPVLVMIPGTLCDGRLFDRQARELRSQAQVVRVDWQHLRHSTDPIDALLRRLPERFSLAGFSLGGLWAVQVLARAPQHVERLALIASNAEGASRRTRRRGATLWRLWQAQGAQAVARACKPAYFHHHRQRQTHAGLVRDMAVATPPRVAKAQFDWAGRRPDGLRVLAQATAPTLLVSGEHDRLCPRALQQRILQAAPTVQWAELPRCGHFLPLEAPARLAHLLRSWLAQPAPISLENPLDHT
jgi:pimeloyl-ACP methyl ester carboxylesterase